MATKADKLPDFFLQDDTDVPEQPRPAPQPTSKPQLEDVFRGRRTTAPILTLKNLQAERRKYKQQVANLKHGLSPIPESESQPTVLSSPQRFQSVLELGKEKEIASPTMAGQRKFRGGSMSDRKRRDLSEEIANATTSALASVQRAETRLKSPSPHPSKPSKLDDFPSPPPLTEEQKRASPSLIPSVPVSSFKPSKAPQVPKKDGNTAKPKLEGTGRVEQRKQASQSSGGTTGVKSILRARSISPMRSLHQTPSKPAVETSVIGEAKVGNKKKKMTKSEASDLAKRLMSTSSAYERL